MKALAWHGKRDVRVDAVPRPGDRVVIPFDISCGQITFATHHLPLDDAPHAYEIFHPSRTARSRSC